ncbi:MAG: TldD/PmbA family protein [Alphaproteobacteria bacterium]|nr:TldD/PmbA family protein [Alphaproteobacteria bacterium]
MTSTISTSTTPKATSARKKILRPRLLALGALLLAPLAWAASAPAAPVLSTAEAELKRVMSALAEEDEPPYHLSYGITDRHSLHIVATLGVLGGVSEDRGRLADVDVRVGSPKLDNTHKLRDASWFSQELRSTARLPLVDDPLATATILWRETDDAWRSAVRRLTKVRANAAVKVEREDTAPDFSPAEPQVDLRAPTDIALDQAAWADTLREVSAVFLDHPDVLDSRVTLDAEYALNVFLSSEGHRLQHPRLRYRVAIQATTIADDGMELSVYDYVDAASVAGLPSRAELLERAEAAATHLEALRVAPVIDPYTGPAILRGRAAGVFFHEVFGHRIEGHRQKDEDEGQTFTDMIGEAILPSFLSVVDDPTLASLAGVDLNGHYPYDDEGVPAERVQLVKDGVLETFLLSRSPVKGFERSNGHGRRQPGNAVVARQGNLIVEASEAVPYVELRAALLEQIEAQGKPYGLIVDDITGGFTLTGRVMPNAFNVRPVSVWRVYADGRPDELVRGGDLIGTPLTTFSRILAAGDDVDVFNGSCGAESGWVPVSAASPSLLLQEIEVQRKETANDRPPLLPAPHSVPATAEVQR